MDVLAEVLAAGERIASHVRRTPLEFSPRLSAATGGRVFLKLENHQRTGSFKFRGAMNKLLSLDPGDARTRGVVAASTGNHGAAVACGAAELGCPGCDLCPGTRGSCEARCDPCIRRDGRARGPGLRNRRAGRASRRDGTGASLRLAVQRPHGPRGAGHDRSGDRRRVAVRRGGLRVDRWWGIDRGGRRRHPGPGIPARESSVPPRRGPR